MNKQNLKKQKIIPGFIFSGLLVSLLLTTSGSSQAMTLDQYLLQVKQKNKLFQSIDASREASENRNAQADLDFSPVLTALAQTQDDKSLQTLGTVVVNRAQTRQYSLGLGKKFSTGTTASVTASVQSLKSDYNIGAASGSSENHTGTMAFSLSQSLWKDFFGEATRLRWRREQSQKSLEQVGLQLQQQQALIAAEATFWDLFTLQQELVIRKEGLERAQKIEGWVHRRFDNGIGEKSDLLNAKGLVAARELELLSAHDDLTAAEKKFLDQMEMDTQNIPPLEAQLDKPREDLLKSINKPIKLDSYMSVLEAQIKSTVALEVKDQMKPDLSLRGSYKTNGYQDTDSAALQHMQDRDYPVTAVGVQLTWLLDWDMKSAVQNTVQKDALAAELKKQRQFLESETAWTELVRRHQELGKKIKAANLISDIQTSKAAAERERLSKGRTITSQVITAEQDAAEAQLRLTKLKAEQRKLETQTKMFINYEGSI